MGSNEVKIQVDSRVFYGLVALLAVAGIFAIGLWLGNQLNGPQQASQPAPVSSSANVSQADPIQLDPGNPVIQADPNTQIVEQGAVPVSVDAVPVGEGQPRLWIPEVADTNFTYSFGTIQADEKAEHDFEVFNVGNATLVIEQASASCGCTAALVADSTLEPGESTMVRVSYDPRVNQEFGKFVTKQVRIKSNDPLVPLAEITVTADVAAQ